MLKKDPDGPEDPQDSPQDGPGRDWTAGRVCVRCSPQWAAWLGQLALHCDVPAATVLNQAVRRFAEQVGFHAPPPFRLRNPEPHLHPRAESHLFGIGSNAEAED